MGETEQLKYFNKAYASFCFCMKICNFAAYYIYYLHI